MKKVLALVLAVMMLSVMAFAAGNELNNSATGSSTNVRGNVLPGDKMKFDDSGLIGENYVVEKAINTTNFALGKIEWTEGKNLVESVTINDEDEQLVVKMKQDYTMTTNKTLKGTITLKGKKSGRTSAPADVKVKINATVGYKLDDSTIEIDANGDIAASGPFSKENLYEVKAAGNVKYGTLEFDAADGDTDVEVRVYEDDKLYLFNNVDANSTILKANADADADITFLNFKGAPTFNSTATVRFYKDEDSFIYGIKDNKLVNVNAKWDDDEGCFILKTRTLGSYVFSDKKLSVSAADAGTNNPDTGANDVVGIATALAAVALVSAAAVSLKK